jgi:hypothetical protein
MPKWEYMEVRANENDHTTISVKVSDVNLPQIPSLKKNVSYMDYLNQLGDQGWEIITSYYYHYDYKNYALFLLKRAKA